MSIQTNPKWQPKPLVFGEKTTDTTDRGNVSEASRVVWKNPVVKPFPDSFVKTGNPKQPFTRWFKVTFVSPIWRSLNPLKGSLNHPKKVTAWITRKWLFRVPGSHHQLDYWTPEDWLFNSLQNFRSKFMAKHIWKVTFLKKTSPFFTEHDDEEGVIFLKLTLRTWKWMIGRWIHFSFGATEKNPGRCELLVSGRVISLKVCWHLNGCFSWMMNQIFIENGCFTKHPRINGCLGSRESIVSFSACEELVTFWWLKTRFVWENLPYPGSVYAKGPQFFSQPPGAKVHSVSPPGSIKAYGCFQK